MRLLKFNETLKNLLINNKFVEIVEDLDVIERVLNNSFLLQDKMTYASLENFWKFLKQAFIKDDIIKMLRISTTTFYKVDQYLNKKRTSGVSEKLLTRLMLLCLIVEMYYE